MSDRADVRTRRKPLRGLRPREHLCRRAARYINFIVFETKNRTLLQRHNGIVPYKVHELIEDSGCPRTDEAIVRFFKIASLIGEAGCRHKRRTASVTQKVCNCVATMGQHWPTRVANEHESQTRRRCDWIHELTCGRLRG